MVLATHICSKTHPTESTVGVLHGTITVAVGRNREHNLTPILFAEVIWKKASAQKMSLSSATALLTQRLLSTEYV
jgi:hypothetical protein